MSSKVLSHSDKKAKIDVLEVQLPSALLYRVAVLTSIIFITAISLGVLFYTQKLSQQRAAHNLITQLNAGGIEAQEQALKSYQASTTPGWLSKVFGLVMDDFQTIQSTTVNNIYAIITNIGLNNFVNASLIYRDRVRPNVYDLLRVLPLAVEQRNSLHLLLKHADQWAANVAMLAQLEIDAPQQMQEIKRRQEQLTLLVSDLVFEFSQLLGFVTAKESLSSTPEFYQSGVLAGLPKIAQIPDDLKDLSELRNSLDKIGVSVTVQGPDAPLIFAQKLKDLKSQSAVFNVQFTALNSEQKQLKDQLDSLRLSVYQDSQSIRSDLMEMLKLITVGNL